MRCGKEGIDDLIAELSPDELDYALSLVQDTIDEVDIRITSTINCGSIKF